MRDTDGFRKWKIFSFESGVLRILEKDTIIDKNERFFENC